MAKFKTEHLELQREVKIFVKSKFKSIKCVDEIFDAQTFKVEEPQYESDEESYQALYRFKKILQICLNCYNNIEIYYNHSMKCNSSETDSFVCLNNFSQYDTDINIWTQFSIPDESVIVEALFNYIVCFLSIKMKEDDNVTNQLDVERCAFCDTEMSAYETNCSICNSSIKDIRENMALKGLVKNYHNDPREGEDCEESRYLSEMKVNQCKENETNDFGDNIEDKRFMNNAEIQAKKLDDENYWKCGSCGFWNKYSSVICEECCISHKDGGWMCKHCTMLNSCADDNCIACEMMKENMTNKIDKFEEVVTELTMDCDKYIDVLNRKDEESYTEPRTAIQPSPLRIDKNEVEIIDNTRKWRCGGCSLFNDYIFLNCYACGDIQKGGSWICGQCRADNSCAVVNCSKCFSKNDNVNEEIIVDRTRNVGLFNKRIDNKNQDVHIPKDEWKCGHCSIRQLYKHMRCVMCNFDRETFGLWMCGSCTLISTCDKERCGTCGTWNDNLPKRYCLICKNNRVCKTEVQCGDCARNTKKSWQCQFSSCKASNMINTVYCYKCKLWGHNTYNQGDQVKQWHYGKERIVWVCKCGTVNELTRSYCSKYFCGLPRYNKIKCHKCGTYNDSIITSCSKCGVSLRQINNL